MMAANTAGCDNESNGLKPVNGLTKRVAGDVFDEWKSLYGYSFTLGFLIESLRTNDEEYKKLHGHRPVKDVTASDISKDKGVVSEVLRCIVYFVDSTSESDVYTTILKVPGFRSMEAANNDGGIAFPIDDETFIKQMTNAHQTEVDFYEHLSKTLDIPVPRVFKTLPWKFGEIEGAVHMEDMTGKGKSLHHSETITIPQIKEIVRYLAHMHKQCLTTEDEEFKLWKTRHNDNQLFLSSFYESVNNAESFLEICTDEEYLVPLAKKYEKFGRSSEYSYYALSQSWKDLNMPPVIVHADFYVGNMMWKVDKNGEATNEIAAVFDWQLSHEGSPMFDLARMLTTWADGWTRRHAEEFIFDLYHDLLEKEMKEAGKSCPYTVDQIRKAYNYVFLTRCYELVGMPKFMNEVFRKWCPRVRQAEIDSLIVRCKHALEDMDSLLSGELKHLYEKYGK